MTTQTIVMVAAGLALIVAVLLANNLIRKRNEVENVFGSVDALLQKRYDLIPNLVAAVQRYMVHEESVLARLTEMRARATSPAATAEERIDIQNRVRRDLDGIMVAVEAYPELKASQNFLQLQAALNEVEEQISAARRAYNAAVTEYNNTVQTTPSNIVAFFMRFRKKPIMETPEQERKNVSVRNEFKR